MKGALLLIGLALLVLFASLEAAVRFRSYASLEQDVTCLKFSNDPLVGKEFQPGCEATLSGPGGDYHFRINSDGWRAPAREHFKSGATAVLGDSHVEGVYLEEENTLVRRLESALQAQFLAPFLNLGIRGSGPSQQWERFQKAQKHYPLRGLIWIINETDPTDEAWTLWRGKHPEAGGRPWNKAVNGWFTPLTGITLAFPSLFDAWRLSAFVRHAVAAAPEASEFCKPLAKGWSWARSEKRPLLFLVMRHGRAEEERLYFGLPVGKTGLDSMVDCLKKNGAPYIDLRKEFSERKEWYWPGDVHLTPEGTKELALAARAALIRGKK